MDSDAAAPTLEKEHPPGSERPRSPRPDFPMIGIVVAAVIGVVLWAAMGSDGPDDSFTSFSDNGLTWVLSNFDWLFVLAADIFLVLCVYLALSRFGRIRLGKDDSKPEFGTLSWIAMMFSAGMGIGLMFFGVGEPLQHFASPPPQSDVGPATNAAAEVAQQYTLFHWTLTPWAIYAVVGLALAYAGFRKGRGNRLSAAFVPLLGERRALGWQGKTIDVLAVFATVFGTATSLGLGAAQVAEGLDLTAGVTNDKNLQLLVIVSLGLAFVASAFSGLHRGVKWLSTSNVILAAVLMVFIFIFGPTVYILDTLPGNIGSYLFNLLPMSTTTNAYGDAEWLGGWTIFYWAWWLSWAPFVGTFIARISKGRTVREFLIGVLLVPSGASAIWFAIMGGTAIERTLTGAKDLAAEAGNAEAALFGMLDTVPLGTLTSWVAMILVMTYFVTSADSASLVMGSLTANGAMQPPRWLVVLWGVSMAAVAGVLLYAGGLGALQTATILVALPFVLVMLTLCWALVKELREDPGANVLPRNHPLFGWRSAMRTMVGEAVEETVETGSFQKIDIEKTVASDGDGAKP